MTQPQSKRLVTEATADEVVASKIVTPGSATEVALSGTFGAANSLRQLGLVAPFDAYPALMVTAPTVTADLTATTIAGTVKDWTLTAPAAGSDDAGPILMYGSATWDNTAPNYTPSFYSTAPQDGGPVVTYETITDAPILELTYAGLSSPSVFRIFINGEQAQADDYSAIAPGGAQRRLAINFGSRALRHVRITTASDSLRVSKATTGITDSLYAPPGGDRRRAAFLMDSYGQSNEDGLQYVAGRLLGYANVMRNAVGGTGYITDNSGAPTVWTRFTDPVRLQAIIDTQASLVVIAGGINDASTTGLAAACDTVYSTLQAGLPNAQFFVVSPWMPSDATKTSKAAIRDVIQTQAAAAGIPFIDTTYWITGTGNRATPTGDGNADTIISTDGTHPDNPDGQQYLGARLAAEISAVWRTL